MENNGDEIALIAIGTFVMTFIALGIIFYALQYSKRIQMRKMSDELKLKVIHQQFYSTLAKTQEDEKVKIARNLHDEVSPFLAAIKNKVQLNSDNIDKEEYKEIINLVSKTDEVVRTATYDLAPPFLIKNGILHTLQNHALLMNNPSLEIDFKNTLSDKNKRFFLDFQKMYIYRICLELLSNIVKHSKPKRLSIQITMEGRYIVFDFSHNGVGISSDEIYRLRAESTGLGLQSIQARVEILHGKIRYFNEENSKGVKLSVPISKV